ncbi:MAG: hypothetical protein WDN69_27385 [Aliidongia sp.]
MSATSVAPETARLTTLGDVVRFQGENRPEAIAFVFEGRITTYRDFDRNTNRVARGTTGQRCCARRSDRLPRQEQRPLFRAAVRRRQSRPCHGAGKLAAGRSGDRLYRRRHPSDDAVRRAGIHGDGRSPRPDPAGAPHPDRHGRRRRRLARL